MTGSRAGALALALLLLGALPAAAADRDGDGLRDGFERRYGVTDPDRRDSDGDGVIDAAEDNDGDKLGNLGEQRFGTHPGKRDSDGDGRADGREDHDRDGRSNAREQDQRPVPAGLRPSLAAAADDISRHAQTCGVRSGQAAVNRCEFGDPNGSVTVALMGDSKATMYLPPFISAARAEGWRLVTLLKGRCSPIVGTMGRHQYELDGGASCREWRSEARRSLAADPPDLVVLSFSDDYTLVGYGGRKIPAADRAAAWSRGVRQTVTALTRSSAVLLLADAPRNVGNPVKCLRTHPRDMSACVTAVAPLTARRIDRAVGVAARASGARYRGLRGKVCPYGPCPLVQGDVLVYRDQGHLTVTFTRLLAPSVRTMLTKVLRAGPASD